ncbi:unnamed protein product [Macrosiphum euphorbiae]|uniref:FLYWCH-type domain-containing protein n=1 Tax=Macrosiphum euphorbiae TaxID=13131 RepID=A0AAV0WQQ4_9HEMI|nr:unnamed protein product [Macrosiphum euphorbiae]
MNNSFEVIETTKGHPLAIHDDYKYRKYRINNANIITWVYLNEKKQDKCKGRLKTTGTKVLSVTNHKCKYDLAKIEVKKIYNIAKQRALDTTCSTAQIFQEEFTPLLEQGLGR